MHIIMYIAILLIAALTVYGGYNSGIYEASYIFFRNVLAFILAFTLFAPLTGFLTSAIAFFDAYPQAEYLEAIFFVVVFVVFIAICDRVRFKYLFSQTTVDINRYADRIGGGLLGGVNGIVLSGFLLILWAMLPFVKYLPGDFGRVNSGGLPVDSGAVLLKVYAYSSDRMGGSTFPLSGEEEEYNDSARDRSQGGWLRYYKGHADFTIDDIERIAAEFVTQDRVEERDREDQGNTDG